MLIRWLSFLSCHAHLCVVRLIFNLISCPYFPLYVCWWLVQVSISVPVVVVSFSASRDFICVSDCVVLIFCILLRFSLHFSVNFSLCQVGFYYETLHGSLRDIIFFLSFFFFRGSELCIYCGFISLSLSACFLCTSCMLLLLASFLSISLSSFLPLIASARILYASIASFVSFCQQVYVPIPVDFLLSACRIHLCYRASFLSFICLQVSDCLSLVLRVLVFCLSPAGRFML